MGRVDDFALKPTTDGFVWEIPTGQMTFRYTAVIKDGTWREVGDRILPGKEPARFFEMNLNRTSAIRIGRPPARSRPSKAVACVIAAGYWASNKGDSDIRRAAERLVWARCMGELAADR